METPLRVPCAHLLKLLACTTTVQCCATDVSQGEQCPSGTECLADGATCSKCGAGAHVPQYQPAKQLACATCMCMVATGPNNGPRLGSSLQSPQAVNRRVCTVDALQRAWVTQQRSTVAVPASLPTLVARPTPASAPNVPAAAMLWSRRVPLLAAPALPTPTVSHTSSLACGVGSYRLLLPIE